MESKLSIEEQLELMKEDYDNDWWKASKIDDFDLKKKVPIS